MASAWHPNPNPFSAPPPTTMRSIFKHIVLLSLSLSSSLITPVAGQEEERIKSQSPDQHDFVAGLTDETFEHQTQASTGQTTGSWLVWFHDNQGDQPKEFFEAMPSEEEWLEDHVVVGSVAAKTEGPRTAERFQIQDTPCFLFLHKGNMYRYEKPTYSWTDIRSFCRDPDATHRGQKIPPPPSVMGDLMKQIQEDPTYALSLAALLGASVLGLVFGRGKRIDAPTRKKRD